MSKVGQTIFHGVQHAARHSKPLLRNPGSISFTVHQSPSIVSTSVRNMSTRSDIKAYLKQTKATFDEKGSVEKGVKKYSREATVGGHKLTLSAETKALSLKQAKGAREEGLQTGFDVTLGGAKASVKGEVTKPSLYGGGTVVDLEVSGSISSAQGKFTSDGLNTGDPLDSLLLKVKGPSVQTTVSLEQLATRQDDERTRKFGFGAGVQFTGFIVFIQMKSTDARTGLGFEAGLKLVNLIPRMTQATVPHSDAFREEARTYKDRYTELEASISPVIQQAIIDYGALPGMDGPDPLAVRDILTDHWVEAPSSRHALQTRNETTQSNFTRMKSGEEYAKELGWDTSEKP